MNSTFTSPAYTPTDFGSKAGMSSVADNFKSSILSGGANAPKEDPTAEESRKPAWLGKKATADNNFGPKTALKQMEIEKKKQEEEEAKAAEYQRMRDENERLLCPP